MKAKRKFSKKQSLPLNDATSSANGLGVLPLSKARPDPSCRGHEIDACRRCYARQ